MMSTAQVLVNLGLATGSPDEDEKLRSLDYGRGYNPT
jgi:hypothetical protein